MYDGLMPERGTSFGECSLPMLMMAAMIPFEAFSL